MELQEAIRLAHEKEPHTQNDTFLLYSYVCDLVGNACEVKREARSLLFGSAKGVSATPKGAKRAQKKKMQAPVPPGEAFVYYTWRSGKRGTSIVYHVSPNCSCLKGEKTVFRCNVSFAKVCNYGGEPRICQRCGFSAPRYPTGVKEKLKAFFWNRFSIGNPVKIISNKKT